MAKQTKPKKSTNTYLLDAGHGGIVNGKYTTAPSKMYTFEDGYQILEGVIVRKIRKYLIELLVPTNISYAIVNHGEGDMGLKKRVSIANELHKKHKNCVYIAIHCNAGKGTGFEVYTSKGETESDKIAEMWINSMVAIFKKKANRGTKERNFYVLKNTACPAILGETFFMDTRSGAELLKSEKGQRKIAQAYFHMIQKCEGMRPKV